MGELVEALLNIGKFGVEEFVDVAARCGAIIAEPNDAGDLGEGQTSGLGVANEIKTVPVGVVTSKFGHLEAKSAIKKRLEEAAKYMPLEQMCLSAQCGFASHTGGNLLSEQEQAAKLRHIVEIAGEVWPSP